MTDASKPLSARESKCRRVHCNCPKCNARDADLIREAQAEAVERCRQIFEGPEDEDGLKDGPFDMNIYPISVKGYNDETDYERRDGFKNGWNAAAREFLQIQFRMRKEISSLSPDPNYRERIVKEAQAEACLFVESIRKILLGIDKSCKCTTCSDFQALIDWENKAVLPEPSESIHTYRERIEAQARDKIIIEALDWLSSKSSESQAYADAYQKFGEFAAKPAEGK